MLHRSQYQLIQKLPELDDRHIGCFVDILISHRYGQRLLFQPHSAAGRTRGDPHKGFILRLGCLRVRLTVPSGHILNQTFKGHIVYAFSALSLVVHLDFFSVGSINQNVVNRLRILFERCVKAELVFTAQRLQYGACKASLICTGLPAQYSDGPLVDAQTLVRNHQILIELHLISQTETIRAGAEGVIKGKASRFHLIDTDSTVRTGKALAEGNRLAVNHIHGHQPVGQLHHRLDGICKTLLDSCLHHETVYHDINVVLNILLQLDLL
ncbi:unknown [Hungatella hathewayi CAG:224]|nr:unknown [Hungatella hathewayi CAG:224]